MSKRAEAVSLEAYPPTYTTVKRHAKRVQSELVDTHKPVRAIFQHGYEQAEKDLALTGEDIRNISKILHQLEAEDWCSELIFDEAARIFNEQREKK